MGLIKILKEYRFVKTVNAVYIKQGGERDGETIFIEREFAYNLPNKGDAVVYKENLYRVGTKWHDRDENLIQIDLLDL